MASNIFGIAKSCFVESNNPQEFIELSSNIVHLETLEELAEKPFKLLLLHGAPGVGKTMLLKKFSQKRSDIYYYERPFATSMELHKALSQDIFSQGRDIFLHLESLSPEQAKIVILDEAQMYDEQMLEAVRILADTKKLKFILAMHSSHNEHLAAKEHFKTRIFKTIHVEAPDLREFYVYIQKKLLRNNLLELAKSFTPTNAKMIYRFTRGNLRESDKFLFTLFDMLEYFFTTKGIDPSTIDRKFIEMAAIYLGYIDA